MKKIWLFGLGNQGEFNYYIFEKTKGAHKVLGKLFSEIFKVEWSMEKSYMDKRDNPRSRKINIERFKDFHESPEKLNFPKKEVKRIDIFYGNKKMFIVVQCNTEKRKKFNNALRKIVKVPRYVYGK